MIYKMSLSVTWCQDVWKTTIYYDGIHSFNNSVHGLHASLKINIDTYGCTEFILRMERKLYVTNYYYGSIPVLNELLLASNGSKSYLISGGNSSYSWVLTRALGL